MSNYVFLKLNKKINKKINKNKYALEKKHNKYINFKKFQTVKNSYNPDNNNISICLILASHCDSELKLKTITNNLTYFNYNSIDVILINSVGLKYNTEVQDVCKLYKNVSYYEIENSKSYDFGKWIHVLHNLNYNSYKFVIFTNDSFIIHEPINHFFNLIYKCNVDLYAYNDSTQCRYHYQSYLFALKQEAIGLFIHNFHKKESIIKNQEDVITEYELNMTEWFNTKQCFLSIGTVPSQKERNIFFNNDILYNKLKSIKLLPFTKIKRIIQLQSVSTS